MCCFDEVGVVACLLWWVDGMVGLVCCGWPCIVLDWIVVSVWCLWFLSLCCVWCVVLCVGAV